MTSKPFQILGVLALFGWTAVGAFMWMEVKNHVTVTVQETSDGQSEESALLAERMSTLSADLDALIAALESNFTLVGQAIGDGADQHAVRSAVIEQRLTSLEAALPAAMQARETSGALRTTLAQLEVVLQQANQRAAHDANAALLLQSSDSAGGGNPETVAMPIQPGPVEPDPRESDPLDAEPAEAVEAPIAVATTSEPEAAAPRKSSFLAFKLPSRDFKFEGEQTFEVLGDLSRVGFDAKSTLHDFSGVSNNVSGSFRIDLAHPDKGISGSIAVKTDSLDTGLDGRDEAMLEHLGSEEYPKIEYVFESFKVSSVDSKAQTIKGTVKGKMTIHGTTKPLEMEISAHVDESRRLVIEGEVPLSRADYNVHVPGKLGVISTDDEVRIWIHLRSRAKAVKSK